MDTKTSPPADYRRRGLLMSSLAIATGVTVSGALLTRPLMAWAQSPSADAASTFLQLSAFLTGKADLDAEIGRRTLQALSATDKSFDARLAALAKAWQAARASGALPDMQAFDSSPLGQDAALRACAVEIVSAWYLGRAGSAGNVRLIAYHEALMYRPTAGITTIPSYQLGGYGYWIAKPSIRTAPTAAIQSGHPAAVAAAA